MQKRNKSKRIPASKEKKLSKAYFIKTTTGIYPLSVLKSVENDDSMNSSQLREMESYMAMNGLVEPPYPLNTFLVLYESNSIFSACVNQIARDVAGLGWSLHLKDGMKEDKREHDKTKDFIGNVNLSIPFRNIIKDLLIDWGAVGFFGLEVIRNTAGDVSRLYRVPAHTIRVHESKTKFCQVRNNKKVWFKEFGSGEKLSSTSGPLGKEDDAHELIYYRNSYPKSDYYGVPNIISATGDVVGLISSRDYNINFFQNYGVPTAIITLTGEWEEGAESVVRNFMSTEIKGVENAHKVLVLRQEEDAKIEIKPIDIDIKESSFNIYEQTRKENVLVAYSMPPERIGVRVVGELGGNVAEEATKIYIQGVVEPLQEDMEDIINKLLLEKGLGIKSYYFKFNDIDIRDTETLTNSLIKQIEYGVITPNEARNKLGLKPYRNGDGFYMLSTIIPIGNANDEEVDGDMKRFHDD